LPNRWKQWRKRTEFLQFFVRVQSLWLCGRNRNGFQN
jgi:hypothetical protein